MIRRWPAMVHVVGRACVLCALALAGVVAVLPGGAQVRDNAPVVAGTSTISGAVFVDGPSKQPARRVRVTLTDVARITPGQTATTDDTGAFAFRDVPAGRFEMQALKTGYLRASYGASRPDRAGTPLVVKTGDAITNIVMTIARGGVIAGVVRDSRGRPVPGISVRVLRFEYNGLTGERTLGSPTIGSSGTTDDRGEYRAYGLPPGSYLVMANPVTASGRSGGSGVDDIRPITADEVQHALQSARSPTRIAPLPETMSTIRTRVNYAPVFHPGVTDIGAATTVALGLSEERGGVDVSIQLVPTATVSGIVTVQGGGALPQPLQVSLVPAGPNTEMLAGAGLRGLSATPGRDGSYVFAGVAPGTYTVKAKTGQGAGRGIAASSGPSMWAAVDVVVSGQDLTIPLTLQPGVTINGRVVFEGAQPAPADVTSLQFRLVPPGSGGMIQSSDGGRVNAEGRFTFTGVIPDAYQFVTQWTSPAASGKWTIKSSVSNGRDAFDAPLRVNANETLDWTITYTDTPAGLSGVFQDRGGRAATDYYILLFSSDRKYWTPGSRRIRMVRPATDGAFTTKGLPPGEYYLAALTDLETGEWNDPALLDSLVKSSVKVTLRDGEVTKQDLRIGGGG